LDFNVEIAEAPRSLRRAKSQRLGDLSVDKRAAR
jgi:hypothetical protein